MPTHARACPKAANQGDACTCGIAAVPDLDAACTCGELAVVDRPCPACTSARIAASPVNRKSILSIATAVEGEYLEVELLTRGGVSIGIRRYNAERDTFETCPCDINAKAVCELALELAKHADAKDPHDALGSRVLLQEAWRVTLAAARADRERRGGLQSAPITPGMFPATPKRCHVIPSTGAGESRRGWFLGNLTYPSAAKSPSYLSSVVQYDGSTTLDVVDYSSVSLAKEG